VVLAVWVHLRVLGVLLGADALERRLLNVEPEALEAVPAAAPAG